jgi:hypothetical protein
MLPTYSTNIHIFSGENYGKTSSNAQILDPAKTYKCNITYPFNTGTEFTIKTGNSGCTLKSFVTILKSQYEKYYAKIHNNQVEDGYIHDIKDLFLEKVIINGNKITVWIGS